MAKQPVKRRFARVAMFPFQVFDGETYIVDPENSSMHKLNEVGSFIWSKLRDRVSLDDLADMVCEEYEVEKDQAEKDVRSFLDVLGRKGLVNAN